MRLHLKDQIRRAAPYLETTLEGPNPTGVFGNRFRTHFGTILGPKIEPNSAFLGAFGRTPGRISLLEEYNGLCGALWGIWAHPSKNIRISGVSEITKTHGPEVTASQKTIEVRTDGLVLLY